MTQPSAGEVGARTVVAAAVVAVGTPVGLERVLGGDTVPPAPSSDSVTSSAVE